MPDLRAFLKQKFEASGGAMSFEEFMALALYDPDFGYYGATIEAVGNGKGDFATTATLSSGLARAVAGWIRAEVEHHDWNGPVNLIEVGPGSGDLASAVLREFGWLKRRKFRLHLVEVSPRLRQQQERRLRGKQASWYSSIGDALDEAGGRALIYSNELFDAFPAKWLRWSADAETWEEIFVEFSEETGLKESWQALPPDLMMEDFSATAIPNRKDGQRIEIQPSVRQWVGELASCWKEGSILSVDYGGSAREIYGRRPAGTVRGYFRNERIEGGGVYRRFGKQDLTVDVNFDDFEKWGTAVGIETLSSETQTDFLKRFGVANDPLIESGAADEFQVLMQRKVNK